MMFKNWKYSLFFALSAIMAFNPMKESAVAIREFTRTFGAGLITGYDVNRVTSNFSRWMLLFALLFMGFTLLINWVKNRVYTDGQTRAWEFLDGFMVIADISIVLQAMSFFQNEAEGIKELNVTTWMLWAIIIANLIYIAAGLDLRLEHSDFLNIHLACLGFTFPIAALLKLPSEDGWQYVIIQLVLLIIGTIVCSIFNVKNKSDIIGVKTLVASVLPITLSWYIESTYLRLGKGMMVGHVRREYMLVLIVIAALGVGLYFFLQKKRIRPDVKAIAYPMLIWGYEAMANQAALHREVMMNIIEDANYGVLISDFLNYGKLPIVEHYGGHMMNYVWEGIWYGLVTGDKTWATYGSYYNMLTPIVAVLFYYVLSKVWKSDYAFWTVLLIPYSDLWSYYGMGLLIAVALISYINKNSYMRAVMIWLACAWVTLYRLDMGFAFDVACVVAIAAYAVVNRNITVIKQTGITLAATLGGFGILWCILCLIKDINPVSRLIEFLKISASNLSWSYEGIGDPALMAYSISYLVLPFIMIILIMIVLFSKDFRERASQDRWIILIMLGVAYFVNFNRGLTRHSLEEGMNFTIIWFSAILFIAIFVATYIGEATVMPVGLSLLLLTGAMSGGGNPDYWGLIGSTASQLDAHTSHWQEPGFFEQSVDRVTMQDNFYDKVWPLGNMVDRLLSEDETFVDFCNCTALYGLLGRENPAYVSQSPMQLAGEYTQLCFIEEISKDPDHNPIVVMPNSPQGNNHHMFYMDGVANSMRNYLVAEYIYTNYRPLCWDDEYAIWCLNSRYDEMKVKAETAGEYMMDYGWDRVTVESGKNILIDDENTHHIYPIDKLSMYWGELDYKDAASNAVITEAEVAISCDNVFVWDESAVTDKNKGNYLKFTSEVTSDEQVPAVIRVGCYKNNCFEEFYRYEINLAGGEHTQLIRISNDYFWYGEDINSVMIEADCTINNAQILMGD